MSPTLPLPLHVLTGFLGSGKTTVLAELLRRPGGERVAVLVNEVGDLALDPYLLPPEQVERIDEDVLTLASGCVCCSVRGELYEAIERVARLHPTRVVLETTGLADPAPILHGLATDRRVAARVRPAGVVAVVDAQRAEGLLAEQPEARRQLELADRIVLTKTDLAPHRVEVVRALLAEAAPGCEVRAAVEGRVDAAWLLDAPALGRLRTVSDARTWLHHGGPAHGASAASADRAAAPTATHSFASEAPADVEALVLWLRLVTQLDGPRLLRIKILATCGRTGDAIVLQSAGRTVSPPRRLARPPAGWRGVRGVVIERGLGERAAGRLLESLRAAAPGQATRA